MLVLIFSTSVIDLKFQFHVIFSLIECRPRALSVCGTLRLVNLYISFEFYLLSWSFGSLSCAPDESAKTKKIITGYSFFMHSVLVYRLQSVHVELGLLGVAINHYNLKFKNVLQGIKF